MKDYNTTGAALRTLKTQYNIFMAALVMWIIVVFIYMWVFL